MICGWVPVARMGMSTVIVWVTSPSVAWTVIWPSWPAVEGAVPLIDPSLFRVIQLSPLCSVKDVGVVPVHRPASGMSNGRPERREPCSTA